MKKATKQAATEPLQQPISGELSEALRNAEARAKHEQEQQAERDKYLAQLAVDQKADLEREEKQRQATAAYVANIEMKANAKA